MLREIAVHEFDPPIARRDECAATWTTTLEHHRVAARRLAFIAPQGTTR